LEVDKIPLHPRVREVAAREGVPAWAFSLASGGDFQFIVTVPARAKDKLEALGFTMIGGITKDRSRWFLEEGGKLRWKIPEVGHKDRKGQRFSDEIRQIVQEMSRGRDRA
jgi:thiamine monophosphate kinase